MSLPKYLHALTKDVLMPSQQLLSDDISATAKNIKVQQKDFRTD